MEGLAHLGRRLVVGTAPGTHLLPGAGFASPELDVAGNQLIPTCRDTNSHQQEEDERQSERSLPTPSAHLEWVLLPSAILGSQGPPSSNRKLRPRWGTGNLRTRGDRATGLQLVSSLRGPPRASLLMHASSRHTSAPQQPDSCLAAPTFRGAFYIPRGCREVPGLGPSPVQPHSATTVVSEEARTRCLVLSGRGNGGHQG